MRLTGSILFGAFATLAIFAGMHYLIKEQPVATDTPPPIVMIDAIMQDLPDSKEIVKTLTPPPEIVAPPASADLLPADNNEGPSIGIAEFTPPDIDNNLTQPAFVLDQQPRPMVRVNPSYPSKAARDGVEGFVTLSFSVNAQGEVEDIVVVDAQPKGMFERDAQRALRKWKYQAKRVSGKAVAMQGLMVTLDFSLGES